MTDQELDALMKRVLVDSMKLDLEADTKDNTAFFNPSSRYQRQMRAMLKDPLGWAKKKARPKWKNIALEAAMILLVISLGFCAVMVSSPTARAAFARWIEELYETYIIYRYSGDSTSGEMPRYEITELPEGFAERDRIELSRTTSVTYANEAENVIYFGYSIMVQGGAIVYDDIDNSDVYDIKVNQMSGHFFESRSPEKFNTIIWIDTKNNIQFDISGVYDYTDILHIAESVSLSKTTK